MARPADAGLRERADIAGPRQARRETARRAAPATPARPADGPEVAGLPVMRTVPTAPGGGAADGHGNERSGLRRYR